MKDIFAEYEATSRTSTNSSDVYAVEEVQELESPASAETAMQVFFFSIFGYFALPLLLYTSYSIYTFFFQLEQELQSDVGTPQTEDEPLTGMDISDQLLSSSSVQVFSGTHLQPS